MSHGAAVAVVGPHVHLSASTHDPLIWLRRELACCRLLPPFAGPRNCRSYDGMVQQADVMQRLGSGTMREALPSA
jgi:hypothetical protein